MIEQQFKNIFVTLDQTIRQAILCIDQNERGIALVVDAEQHLLGTITDGDVRRAMLSSLDLETPLSVILERRVASPYPQPVTAPQGSDREALLQVMQERQVRQVPILDEQGRVVDLVTQDDLLPTPTLGLKAVIMAGGFGTRLRPLTEDLPKPMLPVGNRPLMERIVEQLRQAGIRQVDITTYYKPEKIQEHFGDGHDFGIQIAYVNEAQPLGTGGALGLIPQPAEPLLVINGDILTRVDFRSMLAYHQDQKADMTVAVRQYELQVPYGVIQCDGSRVTSLSEKPRLNFFVNAGIYLLEPVVYNFIPSGERFNMTDLIQWLLNASRTVVSFPVREYWLDIGEHAEYSQAQVDVKEGRVAP